MVELVDTLDLKSNDQQRSCGFKSRFEYKNPLYLIDLEGFLILMIFDLLVELSYLKISGRFKSI
jgi:hypothetical protein